MTSAWAGFAEHLSTGRYLAMGLMVLAGAAMQGVGGLGYAMFCAPLAAIFFPELVPGPLLAVGAPLALLARADNAVLPAAPTADQSTTAKLVHGLLSDSRYAYRPRALDDALALGIRTAPGDMFSNTGNYGNFLRLSCGMPFTAQIEDAYRVLGRLMHEQLGLPARG